MSLQLSERDTLSEPSGGRIPQRKTQSLRHHPFSKPTKPSKSTDLEAFSEEESKLIRKAAPLFTADSLRNGLVFFSLEGPNAAMFQDIASKAIKEANGSSDNGKCQFCFMNLRLSDFDSRTSSSISF